MNTNLSNKTALVCGASQGIGAACAEVLAEQGCNVILLARSRDKLEAIEKRLNKANGQKHAVLALDLNEREGLLKALADKKIDILINNSGGPAAGPISEAQDNEFLQAFSQHVLTNRALVESALPHMRSKKYGRIINIISTSVKVPIPNLGVSNTIRWAVAGWAKSLAQEVAKDGITVNNILPGYTETPRLAALLEKTAAKQGKSVGEVSKDWEAKVPAARFAKPSEIASVVAFLASPAAAYVNGVALPVDGGRTGCL